MTEPAWRSDTTDVRISPIGLDGILGRPRPAGSIVLFAHGSGSGRFSPRNNYVAGALRSAGLATLLFDLLTEEEAADRRNVFDVELLAERLALATAWVGQQEGTKSLPIGNFGASTGAAAALVAAARGRPGSPRRVGRHAPTSPIRKGMREPKRSSGCEAVHTGGARSTLGLGKACAANLGSTALISGSGHGGVEIRARPRIWKRHPSVP